MILGQNVLEFKDRHRTTDMNIISISTSCDDELTITLTFDIEGLGSIVFLMVDGNISKSTTMTNILRNIVILTML